MINRVKGFFDIEGPFYAFITKLGYVFVLNILFIITCLPIITVGASITAMNAVFFRIINEQSFSLIKDYFRVFKNEFLKSTAMWLMALALGVILYVDIVYWAKYGIDDGAYGYVMLVISIIAAVCLVMMAHTVFQVIARFDMSIKENIMNSFFITAANILYVIEALFFTVIIVGGTVYMVITGYIVLAYMLFLCFGLNGLVQSYIYRRVLNRYSQDYDDMLEKQIEELKKEGYFDDEDI